MKTLSIKGMHDLFVPEIKRWQTLESLTRAHFHAYNFEEIRTPLLEFTPLFSRSIGEDTGIVKKEMYTFEDKGGESVTLRPEGTASVVRAYLEHHFDKQEGVSKFYYMGPMFRYERPQKGRLRQFHQIGCELMGSASSWADVELIALLNSLIRGLGVTDFQLELNSLGCLTHSDCRPTYLRDLKKFFESKKKSFCQECVRRLETNPLRIFDCKNEACQKLVENAPDMISQLCGSCREHFSAVQDGLSALKIVYNINNKIVRGLDYYDKTAFELKSAQLGAQDAFAGGGRYGGLIASLGGPEIPAVGFAVGMERLLLLLPEDVSQEKNPKIYFAALGDQARHKAFELAASLRQKGLVCEIPYEDRSLKALLREANRWQADYAVILGENELRQSKLVLKKMKGEGGQEEISLESILSYFFERYSHTLNPLKAQRVSCKG